MEYKEENHDLEYKSKRMAKKNLSGGATSQDTKKYMSRVKCFSCWKTSHYISQCSRKNKGKGKKEESLDNQDEE